MLTMQTLFGFNGCFVRISLEIIELYETFQRPTTDNFFLVTHQSALLTLCFSSPCRKSGNSSASLGDMVSGGWRSTPPSAGESEYDRARATWSFAGDVWRVPNEQNICRAEADQWVCSSLVFVLILSTFLIIMHDTFFHRLSFICHVP